MTETPFRSFALPAMPEGRDPGLNWAALGQPLSADRPGGESLRYEGTLDRIKDARRADDPALPQGVWQTALKVADWKQVQALSQDALETRSKDLQIAVWLTEGLVHLNGFGGLAAGLEVVRLLCADFWDSLHPEIEDGDADGRIAAIAWLNQHLVASVIRIPFCVPPDGASFGLSDWQAARTYEARGNRHPEESEKKYRLPDTAAVQTALRGTPQARVKAMSTAIAAAVETTRAIDAVLDQALGREAPGLTRLREALGEIAQILTIERTQRGEPEDDPATATATATPSSGLPLTEETAMDVPDAPSVTGSSGPVASRDAAYRALGEAADFLMRTEPHSPVPYLVRKAVRWGRLPLVELLTEMAGPEGDLRRLYEVLGMEPPAKR